MLVELVVVVMIIGLLVAVIIVGYGGAIRKAQDAACAAGLRSSRTAIQAYRASRADALPPSLAVLVPEYLDIASPRCPETKQPYLYSPLTGRVSCNLARHAAY